MLNSNSDYSVNLQSPFIHSQQKKNEHNLYLLPTEPNVEACEPHYLPC